MPALPDFPAPHPGSLVAEHLDFLGQPTAKAAQTLQNLIKQDRPSALSAEMAMRLERSFGLPIELLMRLQAAHDLWMARQVGSYVEAQKAA